MADIVSYVLSKDFYLECIFTYCCVDCCPYMFQIRGICKLWRMVNLQMPKKYMIPRTKITMKGTSNPLLIFEGMITNMYIGDYRAGIAGIANDYKLITQDCNRITQDYLFSDLAVIHEHLDCLHFSLEKGYKYDAVTQFIAVGIGSIALLKYIHQRCTEKEYTSYTSFWICKFAVLRNKFNVLKYMIEIVFPRPSLDAYEVAFIMWAIAVPAIQCCRLEILVFACEITKTPVPVEMCLMAEGIKDPAIIDFLHKTTCAKYTCICFDR
jgi:hypothetical protein